MNSVSKQLVGTISSKNGVDRNKTRFLSPIEALESRVFLSGTVLASVVGGNLHVVGGNTADVIVLDQTGLNPDQVRITPVAGTQINNQSAALILSGITRNVTLDMGRAADTVTMRNLILPGNVKINGRAGAITVLDNVQITKGLMVSNGPSFGATTITDSTVGAYLAIVAGSGGENATLQSVVVQHQTSIITDGKGADHIIIDDSTFHGPVAISTGNGADVVQLDSRGNSAGPSTLFDKLVSISLHGGNDILQLGVTGQTGNHDIFAREASFYGGIGFDTLSDMDASAFNGNPPSVIRNFESFAPAATITDPTVSSTAPVNNAANVFVNQKITATFSQAMNPSTITASNVFVTGPGSAIVTGTVTYVGTTMTFTPTSPLAPDTLYTLTISTGATDLAGNPLNSDFVSKFTTGSTIDTTPPQVSSTNPTSNTSAVALNIKIAATFSEAMDPTTINTASVSLTAPGVGSVAGTVTYVGNTMTFTPTSPLAATTLYTATILNTAADLAGNHLVSNYVWSFTTGATADTTAPTVSSTSPANNAATVPLNSAIAATFSEAMDPTTINTASVSLTAPGVGSVAGTVAYVGDTMTFTPASPLAGSTVYTATISNTAADLAGNKLASNYVWSFTTGATADTTPPTVSSTNPANNGTVVPTNSAIAATFSEAMDPTTINTASVSLTAPGTGSVAGTVTYVGDTMTFTPTTSLAGNTLYTATIANTAADLAGNHLVSNYVWSFTTGATADTTPPTVTSTNPTNVQTNVLINKTVNATFSEAVNAATISTATFKVTAPGNVPVTGTVTYNVTTDTATFTPSSNLAVSTTFTATISSGSNGVKDLAGNALVADKVWTFTTGTQIAQAPINLGSASTFAVMATAAITSTGPTEINGDVGLNPGSAQGIPISQVNGNIHVDDQAARNAQTDLLAAYNDAINRSTTSQTLPGNIGGLTFTPGLYTNSTSVLIQGAGPSNIVTLNAQGDPNAVFIFQMGSTLTTGPGAQVVLAGGAKASNVFWQVGSSATLNTTTSFQGSILAAVSITVDTGSTVEGRLLGGSDSAGSVSIDASTITLPT